MTSQGVWSCAGKPYHRCHQRKEHKSGAELALENHSCQPPPVLDLKMVYLQHVVILCSIHCITTGAMKLVVDTLTRRASAVEVLFAALDIFKLGIVPRAHERGEGWKVGFALKLFDHLHGFF